MRFICLFTMAFLSIQTHLLAQSTQPTTESDLYDQEINTSPGAIKSASSNSTVELGLIPIDGQIQAGSLRGEVQVGQLNLGGFIWDDEGDSGHETLAPVAINPSVEFEVEFDGVNARVQDYAIESPSIAFVNKKFREQTNISYLNPGQFSALERNQQILGSFRRKLERYPNYLKISDEIINDSIDLENMSTPELTKALLALIDTDEMRDKVSRWEAQRQNYMAVYTELGTLSPRVGTEFADITKEMSKRGMDSHLLNKNFTNYRNDWSSSVEAQLAIFKERFEHISGLRFYSGDYHWASVGFTLGKVNYERSSNTITDISLSAAAIDLISVNGHISFRVADSDIFFDLCADVNGTIKLGRIQGAERTEVFVGGIEAGACAGVTVGKVGRLSYDFRAAYLSGALESRSGRYLQTHQIENTVRFSNIANSKFGLFYNHSQEGLMGTDNNTTLRTHTIGITFGAQSR